MEKTPLSEYITKRIIETPIDQFEINTYHRRYPTKRELELLQRSEQHLSELIERGD